MTAGHEDSGFEIFACPHPVYEDTRLPGLRADEAVRDLADLLRPWGGRLDEWLPADQPRTAGRTDARVKSWQRRSADGNTTLIWIGHGRTDTGSRQAFLIVRGDREAGAGATGDVEYLPEAMIRAIKAQQVDRRPDAFTIVVFEACGGARFAELVEIGLKDLEIGGRTLLIGSGAPRETQFTGTLHKDLARILDQVTEDSLSLRGLAALLREVDDADEKQRYTVADFDLGDSSLNRVVPGPVTAVWSDYRHLRDALDLITADSEAHQPLMHYATKGTGTDLGEFAWHFVGRRRERREIFDWLRVNTAPDGQRLLVVSGPPGSGKSALLGSVLIDCQPKLAAALHQVIGGRSVEAPGETPPAFDLMLHLTGATVHSTAAQIRTALGADPADRTDVVAAVYHLIRARSGRPLRILADALDESEEPLSLAHFFDDLLRRFPVIMVVGTRERVPKTTVSLTRILVNDTVKADRAVLTLEPSTADVLDSLTVRIRNRALADRVRHLLEGREQAGSAEHQFLWAAMAAEEINARSAELTAHPDRLERLLATNHNELFGLALERLGEQTPHAYTALLALALAHGRGLPRRDRIWEEVATALAPGHQPITYADIDAVLNAAGAYIMLDHENGQGVYRLVHRVLQEQLLDDTRELPQRQLHVFRQLLGHVRRESPLNPYLRTRLSAHAGHSTPAAWDELAGRLDVLDRLDPYAVAGDARRSSPVDRLPVPLLGTMTTAHLARGRGDEDRPGLRTLGEAWIEGRVPQAQTAGAWSVRWAKLPRRPAHLPIGDPDVMFGGTRALARVPRSDGPSALAATAGGTTVRIWDPVSGQPAGATVDIGLWQQDQPRAGDGIAALAAVTDHDRTLLSGAPVNGEVVVWDPSTGQRVLVSIARGASVVGLAAYRTGDGAGRLAVALRSGAVERWDPARGRPDGSPLRVAVGQISTIEAVELPGTTVITVLTRAGSIEAWDARTGRPWSGGAALGGVGVDLTVLSAGNEEIVLAVLAGTGSCYRCRLRPADTERIVLGSADLLFSVPMAERICGFRTAGGGRQLALTDRDGEVFLWDPDRPDEPLAGWRAHRDPVDALVAGDPADDPGWILATIGKGVGVARVWPASALAVGPDTTGAGNVHRAVVAGDHVVLAGRRRLMINDARDGRRLGEPLDIGEIVGLTAAGGPGRIIVAATRETIVAWAGTNPPEPRVWSHAEPIRTIAGTAGDEAWLATLDTDGVLRRWNFDRGATEPETAATRIFTPNAVACFRDGVGVTVALGHDDRVHLWRHTGGDTPQWTKLPAVGCGKLPMAISAVDRRGGDPAAFHVVTHEEVRCFVDGAARWRLRLDQSSRLTAVDSWRTATGRVRLAAGNAAGQVFLIDGTTGRLVRTVPTGLGINAVRGSLAGDRQSLVIGAREGAVVIDLTEAIGQW